MFSGNLIKQANLVIPVTSVKWEKHRAMFIGNLIMPLM